MRLALAGCSDSMARRFKATLSTEEIVVVPRRREGTTDACDVILLSDRCGGASGGTCAQVVGNLRGQAPHVPILVVVSEGGSERIVDVLDAGADAVVTRPLDPDELRVRLRGLVRRGRGRSPTALIRYGGLSLERLRNSARGPKGSIELTPREVQILHYLMTTADRVVGRTEIQEAVWGPGRTPSTNALDVHISHLRSKLEKVGAGGLIHTIRAVGILFGSLEEKSVGPRVGP